MPERYKNKYRIESARAQWWNYGRNGAYFITICTKNQAHFFGEVKNGKMVYSSVFKSEVTLNIDKIVDKAGIYIFTLWNNDKSFNYSAKMNILE